MAYKQRVDQMEVFKQVLQVYGIFILPLYILSYLVFLPVKRYAFKRLHILKFNYRILLFSISVLFAFLISINATILSNYDRSGKWKNLSAYNVIMFPFEQLEIEHDNLSPQVINSVEKPRLIDGQNYFIIVDKTESTILPESFKPKEGAIKDILINKIKKTDTSISADKVAKKHCPDCLNDLELRDLIVVYFLKRLYNLTPMDTKVSYQIALYYGNNIVKFLPDETGRKSTETITLYDSYNAYCDTLAAHKNNTKTTKHNRTKQETDFSEIFEMFSYENISNKSGKRTNVILISDFRHEPTNTSFKTLEKKLENKIIEDYFKLSLFKLWNEPKEKLHAQWTDSTLELIDKYFKNSVNYLHNEEEVLKDPQNLDLYIHSLFSYNVNEAKELNFYFPKKNIHEVTSSKALLKLKGLGTTSSILFKFNNQNLPFTGAASKLIINNQYYLFQNKNYPLNFDFTKPFRAEISTFNQYQSDNYIEIKRPNSLVTHRHKINILEEIPTGSILIMCICSIISLSVLLINSGVYFHLAFKSLKRKSRNLLNVSYKEKYKNISFTKPNTFRAIAGMHLLIIIWLAACTIYQFAILISYHIWVALFLLILLITYVYLETEALNLNRKRRRKRQLKYYHQDKLYNN